MNRYFAFVIRQKKRNVERWEQRPWLMLVLELTFNVLRHRQLLVAQARIRELERELGRRH